jgi:hypothetical protein
MAVRCEKLSFHDTDPYFFFNIKIDPNWIFLAQECKDFDAAIKNCIMWNESKINGGYGCEKWNNRIKKITYAVYGEDLALLKKEGDIPDMILIMTSDGKKILLNKFEKRVVKMPLPTF